MNLGPMMTEAVMLYIKDSHGKENTLISYEELSEKIRGLYGYDDHQIFQTITSAVNTGLVVMMPENKLQLKDNKGNLI